MRSLVLDELNRQDIEKIRVRLSETLVASNLPDVFWLELPPDLLSAEQREHTGCGPHRFALVLEEGALRLELLVRCTNSLRCSCTQYASEAQRRFLLAYMDRMVEELELRT